MNYSLEFKKFLNSQHLYSGIRISLGVLIPAVILYQFGMLELMINLPLGALFCGLADPPGPPIHRRNGLIAATLLNTLMVIIGTASSHYPILVGIEVAILGFVLSMMSVFGNRAGSIGLIAMIIFVLQIKVHSGRLSIWEESLLVFAGCSWYAIFSTVFYNIRPFRPIQHSLGELLIQSAEYLESRAGFYDTSVDPHQLYTHLFSKQVSIHHNQEVLREMLFSTRKMVAESTRKGRNLMKIFVDSVDLMERIMTAQQNYQQLHKEFGESGILDAIKKNILTLASALNQAGYAIHSGVPATVSPLDDNFHDTWNQFQELRKNHLSPDNVDAFITLRHIMYSLEDLTQRIIRIQQYSNVEKANAAVAELNINLRNFKSNPRIERSLFLSNLTLQSQTFRHAIRLSLAMVLGYLASLLLHVEHGYWILLTIATIMKPAYSLSKQRNIQRLAGTFAGAAIAFGFFYLQPSNSLIFGVMVVCMVIAYSFLQKNYGVSTFFLTFFILLSFRFLDPRSTQELLIDRIIDTAIGSVIAYIVSMFVLPIWESDKMEDLMMKAHESNKKYFLVVAGNFVGNKPTVEEYKILRKDAFVHLANLSDSLQRMLSEPKSYQGDQNYFQFVSYSHMLTSQIAALSAYAQKFGEKYAGPDFQPLINIIMNIFDEKKTADTEVRNLHDTQLFRKIDKLRELRKKEISGEMETSTDTRFTLSELKTITDQFRLIGSTVIDINKVKQEMKN